MSYVLQTYLNNEENIKSRFGCASLPTNYNVISTLTNLKKLYLFGVENTGINIIRNIPKSVEKLIIGGDGDPSYYFKLTQKIVDALSKLTNLKSLTFRNTEITDNVDMQIIVNSKILKNLLKFGYAFYVWSRKLI